MITKLRLASANLQYGRANDTATLAEVASGQPYSPQVAHQLYSQVAQQLRELNADLVLLQEVDLHQNRSGRVDLAGLLAEQAGYPHWRFAATYAGGVDRLRHRPRRSQVRTFGDDPLRVLEPLAPLRGFGNAILSRLPVQTWRVEWLGRGVPTIVRREGGKLPYALFTASTRLMLAATLVDGVGQVPLNVASVHLATHPTTARRQLAHAWWKLAGLPGAHILGGDMNMDDVALARIGVGRQLGQGVTFPSAAPSRRIDHFLTDALPPLDAVGQVVLAQGVSAAAAPGTPAAAVAGASAQGVSAAPSQGTPAVVAPGASGQAASVQGAPASGAPAGGPSAQAVDSGTFKLAISDHLVTWVDLEF